MCAMCSACLFDLIFVVSSSGFLLRRHIIILEQEQENANIELKNEDGVQLCNSSVNCD